MILSNENPLLLQSLPQHSEKRHCVVRNNINVSRRCLIRPEQNNYVRFLQEVQPLTSIVQFTVDIFDTPCHHQWSCLMSLN
ncbi:hypothetical protein TNCV_3321281 [Trichonephila clavipes]|nr:hypothetical protein TNCV_3321281 [Trichonephila clavipes]